jgi:hypothetical protein
MWEARLKDGSLASEEMDCWSNVKHNIDALRYWYNDVVFHFPKGEEYIQFKTASASLSGGEAETESQTIGVISNNQKTLTRFWLKQKRVDMFVEPVTQ